MLPRAVSWGSHYFPRDKDERATGGARPQPPHTRAPCASRPSNRRTLQIADDSLELALCHGGSHGDGCGSPFSPVRLPPGSGQQWSDFMVAPARGERETVEEAVTDTDVTTAGRGAPLWAQSRPIWASSLNRQGLTFPWGPCSVGILRLASDTLLFRHNDPGWGLKSSKVNQTA